MVSWLLLLSLAIFPWFAGAQTQQSKLQGYFERQSEYVVSLRDEAERNEAQRCQVLSNCGRPGSSPYQLSCGGFPTSCKRLASVNPFCTKNAGCNIMGVDEFNSKIRLPPGLFVRGDGELSSNDAKYSEALCVHQELDTWWRKFSSGTGDEFSFFGSLEGVQRTFPGRPWARIDVPDAAGAFTCQSFAPWQRPWWAVTVSPPKVVIFGIDNTLTMGGSLGLLSGLGGLPSTRITRLQATKDAVNATLYSLRPGDVVGIVTADEQLSFPPIQLAYGGDSAVRERQLQSLSTFLYNISVGATPSTFNLHARISQAATMAREGISLEPGSPTTCAKFLVLLTDGNELITDFEQNRNSLAKYEAGMLGGAQLLLVRVGDYSGQTSTPDTLLQPISCQLGGVASKIEDPSNPSYNLKEFHQMSAMFVQKRNASWLIPYKDANFNENTTSGCLPAFNPNGVLQGVVCTDVLVSSLKNITSDETLIAKELSRRIAQTNVCLAQQDINLCTLEALRVNNKYSCPAAGCTLKDTSCSQTYKAVFSPAAPNYDFTSAICCNCTGSSLALTPSLPPLVTPPPNSVLQTFTPGVPSPSQSSGLTATTSSGGSGSNLVAIVAVLAAVVVVALVACCVVYVLIGRRKKQVGKDFEVGKPGVVVLPPQGQDSSRSNLTRNPSDLGPSPSTSTIASSTSGYQSPQAVAPVVGGPSVGRYAPDRAAPAGLMTYDYQELAHATRGFSVEKRVGEGGFGVVYEGRLPNGMLVAVKVLKETASSDIRRTQSFEEEVAILSQLRHRSLVPLLGYCNDMGELLLVYEFVRGGTLARRLHVNGLTLDWQGRVKIAKDVAAGLKYLHCDLREKVFHRDIKSSNVLLGPNNEGLLSDFGFARSMDPAASHMSASTVGGTQGYIAPEWREGRITEKGDVYSYGVLLLEMVTGRRPSDCDLVEFVRELVTSEGRAAAAKAVIDPRIKSQAALGEVDSLLGIALVCVEREPRVRPRMPEVQGWLDQIWPDSGDSHNPSSASHGDGTHVEALHFGTPR